VQRVNKSIIHYFTFRSSQYFSKSRASSSPSKSDMFVSVELVQEIANLSESTQENTCIVYCDKILI